MIVYKLTRQDRTTRDGFKYPPKGSRLPELDGKGELCSGHWYHGYAHPLLAVLNAPVHVDANYTKMIEIDVPEVYAPSQMKLGFTTGIVGKVVPLPKIALEQKRRYAIGCACSVYKDRSFRKWADGWISGKDRSAGAAWEAAWEAAWSPAKVAARSSTRAVDEVDWSTAKAVMVTVWVAKTAEAAGVAARKDLDLIRIAKWAMTDEPLSALLGRSDK